MPNNFWLIGLAKFRQVAILAIFVATLAILLKRTESYELTKHWYELHMSWGV